MRFNFIFFLILFSVKSFGAACCGGGSALPSLISSDDAAQVAATLSSTQILKTTGLISLLLVTATIVWGGARAGTEREDLACAMANAGTPVPEANVRRMGALYDQGVGVGGGVPRGTAGEGKGYLGDTSESGVQVDSDPVEVLAGSKTVQRDGVPESAGATELSVGQEAKNHGCLI